MAHSHPNLAGKSPKRAVPLVVRLVSLIRRVIWIHPAPEDNCIRRGNARERVQEAGCLRRAGQEDQAVSEQQERVEPLAARIGEVLDRPDHGLAHTAPLANLYRGW